jgi:hypothetical protein
LVCDVLNVGQSHSSEEGIGVNPIYEVTASWVVGEGTKVLDEAMLIDRQSNLPVEFIQLVLRWFQTAPQQ